MLFCMCMGTSWGLAQTIEITGVGRKPLESVTLRSDSLNTTAITNSKGKVDISSFVGARQIVIRYLGYETVVISYEELKRQNFELALRSQSVNLGDFTVVATRWEQSQEASPHMTVSMDRKSIEAQNPQTSADLLGQSGLVYVQKSQQGGGSPMIRGFAANRVLLQVDGIRMNNAIFRSGNLQNVISIDPLAVDRTEVLFGPGSVTYGSDAIGGVMGFYTLPLVYSNENDINVLGRFSTANSELTEHIDVTIGSKKLAYTGSFTYNSFGDLMMGRNGPDDYLRTFYVETENDQDSIVQNEEPRLQVNSGYEQWNTLQKLGYKANENTELRYTLVYSETSNYDRYDRLEQTRNEIPKSAEWYYGPQVWMMNHLNLIHQKKRKFYDGLSLHLAHQLFKESRNDRDFNTSVLNRHLEQVNALSLNVDFQKKIRPLQTLDYGLDIVLNDVASKGFDYDRSTELSLTAPARYPEALWSSAAAYITYSRAFGSKVKMETGLRYNHFLVRADFDTAFYSFPFTEANNDYGSLTGSLGWTFKLRKNLLLRNNISTGFRAPNIDDLGKVFDSEPGAVVVPNPGLRPEYAYNIDFSLAHEIGRSFKYDFTVFGTLLDQAMVRRDFTFNGQDSFLYEGVMSRVQAIQNATQTKLYGFQINTELKLAPQWSLYSRFSYQNGEEELEDGTTSRPRHAAPWFGSSGVSWKKNKTNIVLYGIYNGELSASQLPIEERGKAHLYALDQKKMPYSPGWATVNIRSGFGLTDFFEVNIALENILNARYRTYSSGLAAPGRNLILSMKARLGKI